MRRVMRALACVLLILSLAGITGGGQAQPRRVLGIAMATTPPNVVHLPAWVAQELGIFSRYALEVKIFTFEGGPAALRALLGGRGEVHLAAPAVSPFVAALARGVDLKAVYSYAMPHPVVLVVQPQIRRCEDLRGKKLGTPGGVGAYAEVMTRAVLRSCGLSPRDVQYVSIATAARVQALVGGQIDGIVMHLDQAYEALGQMPSLRILSRLWEVLPRGWFAAYVTTGEVVREQPRLLQDAVCALMEAQRLMYQKRSLVIDVAVKYTGFSREVVARTYDELSRVGSGLSTRRCGRSSWRRELRRRCSSETSDRVSVRYTSRRWSGALRGRA